MGKVLVLETDIEHHPVHQLLQADSVMLEDSLA
jgi:hypothetical protein